MSQQQDIYLKLFSMQYLHLGKKRVFIFSFLGEQSIVRAFFRRLMVFKESEESFSLPTLHCTTKLNIGIMYLYVLGCICTLLTTYYYKLILQNQRSSFMMCTFYACVNQTINRETIRRTFMVSKYTQINNIVTNIYVVVHIVFGFVYIR